MRMKTINENELLFVAKHYQAGKLNTEVAWKQCRKQLTKDTTYIHKIIAFAASFALIVSIVFAALFLSRKSYPEAPNTIPTTNDSVTLKTPTKNTTKVFHFQHEPINEALYEISVYYGCTLWTNDTTKQVSGEIQADSLEAVIDALEQTLSIKIEKQ